MSVMHWILSWMPRPYIVAHYSYGGHIIDARHVVYVDSDDDLPVSVEVTIQWMTPRAHARLSDDIPW